ncbi:EamA family transporter, partial [Alphaproteobacteria bacterium]|nr:EamA family transporter [Alphaproteobacteria bacterium]
LEKQSREHVQGRIRAGVLENGTIEMLRLAGVSKRLDNEGFKHNGIELSFKNHGFRIDLKKLTDKHVTVYGQTEVTKDLYEIIEKENGNIINCAEDVLPQKVGEINSFVTFKKNGIENKIMCDFVAGLSVPFLGEKFGWRRWTAILTGFIGVLIILRPGSSVISEGSIFAIIGAVMFAVYLILTRYVSRLDTAVTSFFWTGIGGTVTMTVISFFIWEPIPQKDFLWLFTMCILSSGSHFLMVKTLQIAEASVIQPFSYLQLVFGSIIGVMIFSESIDLMIIVGVTIVIGSGLFTTWREHKKKMMPSKK